MISIVIPAYNAEATIARCADSILAQNYTDFEAIFVDDGSSDATPVLLDDYARRDDRIRVIHQPNRGVSAARNAGLDAVSDKAEFITFCDSDDYVEPTWLGDYIDNYQGQDAIYQNALWHMPDGSLFERSVALPDTPPHSCLTDCILELYTRNTLCYVWAGMFRADVIRQSGLRFDERYLYCEDRVFCLQLARYIKSISIIPARNYHYIFPQGRAYQKFSRQKLDVNICVLQLLSDLLPKVQNRKCIYGDAHLGDYLGIIHAMYTSDFDAAERLRYIAPLQHLQLVDWFLGAKQRLELKLIRFSPRLYDALLNVAVRCRNLR